MISVKQLCKRFGQQMAVNHLSFDLSPGDIVGFLGPNGAGKSTTMKMLTGFLTPSSGEISINGKSLETDRISIQKQIGYLPEGAPAYGEMTVIQFLHFIADIREINGSRREQAIRDVVSKVALEEVLNKTIDNLSKGFKRRVGLAQALIHDPDILILDEPTDGLDPNQKHQVRKLIQMLSKEKIVIISTHILEEVSALCNRVMIIAEGEKRFDGTPDELLKRSNAYNSVHLHLSYAADISGLDELDGVKDMLVDHKTGKVTLIPEPGVSIVHLVSEYIYQRRLPVDQMTVEGGQLDDVFRQLTAPHAAEEVA
ncbi:ABC transporter ATP-binding protein [Alteromonas sediminis]|uniref:ABC transporter ATP-binding protein n=1 Tax=Alteromonas sediminis TaxID=2259342 RepID=A0A3N5YA95_9ALTE|nr:ABC transporter ATP-binding protein [Alteromonas sediminis]RPJ65645.1 ABC transporter ATP-binding protein [Alteromonas sediminis]